MLQRIKSIKSIIKVGKLAELTNPQNLVVKRNIHLNKLALAPFLHKQLRHSEINSSVSTLKKYT